MVVAGLTLIVVPLPIEEPLPQPPAYHFQEAPVPNDPPTTLMFVLLPMQIVGDAAVAPVGSVEAVLTVTVTLAQVVVAQSPSALT